jgi:imidazole glycerol-phosphate synthase subunit HisF
MSVHNRVIVTLLLSGRRMVKTTSFGDAVYLGDPINAVKIFNDKEVDELVVLDIEATKAGLEPNYSLIEDIVSEAFMPVSYGGGISSISIARSILRLGIEKVIVNSASSTGFVRALVESIGSSGVIVSIDYKKDIFGRRWVRKKSGSVNTKLNPIVAAELAERAGAGEILLTSIDHEGQMKGYDTQVVSEVAKIISIPTILNGGAGCLADLKAGVVAGASAVAAGSLFVFHGKQKGILMNYPKFEVLQKLLDT